MERKPNEPEQVPAILGRGLVPDWFAACMEAGGGDPEEVAAELIATVDQRDRRIEYLESSIRGWARAQERTRKYLGQSQERVAELEAQRADQRRLVDERDRRIEDLTRERDRAREEANQLRRDLKAAQDELAALRVGRRETYSRREGEL